TFDEQADGTVLAEGLALVALKRLTDAERAGDRIYAVIRGMGGSSDGRAKGLTAPRPEGQARAVRRAYAEAGYSPATVGCWEAHGTGTVAGDRAELEAVAALLSEATTPPASCTLGSVKTLIGHTKGAAGAAGLIKMALALHQRVLPPHVGVSQPLPLLRDPTSPLALRPEAQPWVHAPGQPRRAGVSALGFGGINFHATLEEYVGDSASSTTLAEWPAELLVWRAADTGHLAALLRSLREALASGARPRLSDLAFSLAQTLPAEGQTLVIVAGSLMELQAQLDATLVGLSSGTLAVKGVYYSRTLSSLMGEDEGAAPALAVLFPGQGSQYPGMLRELAMWLPELRETLDRAEGWFAASPTGRKISPTRLSDFLYPPRRFIENEVQTIQDRLTRTEIAQPALGAVMAGLWAWLARLGLQPAMAGGHSYGEYVALHAAGAVSLATLLNLSEARGRLIVEAATDGELGTMLAVAGDAETVQAVLAGLPGLTFANHNGPRQLVLSGRPADLALARQRLTEQGLSSTPLSVAAAFHSPLVAPARERLAVCMAGQDFQPPVFTVYGNANAQPYPGEPDAIRERLAEHLVAPVRFMEEIQAMYAAGARLFLEVGPKEVLTRLTRRILGTQPHLAVAVDAHGGGLIGLLHALAALLAHGAVLDVTRLFAGRTLTTLDLSRLVETTRLTPPAPPAWLISGARVRRADEPSIVDRPPPVVAERGVGPVSSPLPSSSESSVGVAMSPPTAYTPGIVSGSAPTATMADQAMAAYQETMRQFLQIQERVMLAYFAAASEEASSASAAGVAAALEPPRPVVAAAELPQPVVAPLEPPQSVAPPLPSPAGSPLAAAPLNLRSRLLTIIAERTGYPEEMIAFDQDIEADLGIDSIKRVEILGLLRRSLPEAFAQGLRSEMETVARLPTFQAILDFVQRWLDGQAGASPPLQEHARPFEEAGAGVEDRADLSRRRMQAQPQALPATAEPSLPSGLYLLTPDVCGVADRLSQKLRQAGGQPLLLPDAVWRDEARLQAWLDQREGRQAVRAVIHLLPLGQPPLTLETGFLAWRARLEQDVVALFSLLRLLYPELSRQGRLLTVSSMGGSFGRDYRPGMAEAALGFPAGAGLVGLVKTLNLEWNPREETAGFYAKAIDLDATEAPEALATALFQELIWLGGAAEVGYPSGVRSVFSSVPAPLPATLTVQRQPDADWVVLATGGATGITAEVLRELAPSRSRLVLVGRGPLETEEPEDLRCLETVAALRGYFIAQAQGQSPRPADIERRIRAVQHAREMRANIADLSAAGAQVEYRMADMSDETAVMALLDKLYRQYGRIDAVVHGAGVIEDRLLRDKTLDSVTRVLAAKADSAFLLARHLRPETLRVLMFFTSVAGRSGNRGQSDYAVANEIVNRLAWMLHARWGMKVKIAAINWGAWDAATHGVGMVTPEVRRQFAERGIKLVSPAAGRRWFRHEWCYGPLNDVELIAGDDLSAA
ncbi:MAG: SDR family NAD(P)-dependent oxidoreductase, partial [Gammaproteobacteria bacterium]|nr:SDR family NAD(P)-dependent oxidoreductase [Gammaproteobacteria bacterium]